LVATVADLEQFADLLCLASSKAVAGSTCSGIAGADPCMVIA
jgi:hypothetical protein